MQKNDRIKYIVIDRKLYKITDSDLEQIYPLIVNEKDGTIMVLVPEGEFEMGDGEDKDCPKHTVYLDAYYISVYAVSNRQYGQFIKKAWWYTSAKSPYSPKWKLDHPVTGLSWDAAEAYAKWAGCVLPTEAQWEKAARGPLGLKYPWGNYWDKDKCKDDGKITNEDDTCNVWKYGQGVSGYGTYNQAGNVGECCRDRYDEKYYAKSLHENPQGPKNGSDYDRVYRGGSWRNFGRPEYSRAAYRGKSPYCRHANEGFRLVRPA